MSSKSTPTNAPAAWSLGGEAPAPQKIETREPVDSKDLRTGDTHTGTDPLGRAIGPREDHLHVKKVFDENGEIVTPSAGKGVSTGTAESRAKRVAEATGTKAEDDAGTKPFTPSEVAAAHAAGDVIADPKEK